MNLTQIIKISNSYTDESVSSTDALLYANEAISQINSKLTIELSFFEDALTDYIDLTETWIRRLIVSYMNYSVKMKDTSLNEADRYKQSFAEAMNDFSLVYLQILSDEILGTTEGFFRIDNEESIDLGWYHPRGTGGQ